MTHLLAEGGRQPGQGPTSWAGAGASLARDHLPDFYEDWPGNGRRPLLAAGQVMACLLNDGGRRPEEGPPSGRRRRPAWRWPASPGGGKMANLYWWWQVQRWPTSWASAGISLEMAGLLCRWPAWRWLAFLRRVAASLIDGPPPGRQRESAWQGPISWASVRTGLVMAGLLCWQPAK